LSIAAEIERKARDNSLEVEDLLDTVHAPDAEFGEFLLALARELDWSEEGIVDGRRVVPFRRWATVVATYHEQGIPGLISLIRRDEETVPATFVFGVLKQLKSIESVRAVLEILGDAANEPGRDLELADMAATTFNLILSFEGRPDLPQTVEADVRGFLHALLELELSEPDQAAAVLALRGVGDETSLELIKKFTFDDAWSDTVPATRRSIVQRIGGR
jgi:hypothetical protein